MLLASVCVYVCALSPVRIYPTWTRCRCNCIASASSSIKSFKRTKFLLPHPMIGHLDIRLFSNYVLLDFENRINHCSIKLHWHTVGVDFFVMTAWHCLCRRCGYRFYYELDSPVVALLADRCQGLCQLLGWTLFHSLELSHTVGRPFERSPCIVWTLSCQIVLWSAAHFPTSSMTTSGEKI